MTTRLKSSIFLIVALLILTACAGNTGTAQPTKAPQATPGQPTKAPATAVAATQAGYPAPTQVDPGSVESTGYPAPPEVVPPLVNTGYPAPGTFVATLADGSQKTMAVDMLKTLPKEKISFDGTDLEVLALVDALNQYGIENVNKVTAEGAANSSLTLNKDQIAQSYLDILIDGTVRVVVQGLPQNAWIAGLANLKIE